MGKVLDCFLLRGALLDAEILSKVYLLMTVGQVDFGSMTEEASERVLTKSKKARVKRQNNLPLLVIKASIEDLQLHEDRLKAIEGS